MKRGRKPKESYENKRVYRRMSDIFLVTYIAKERPVLTRRRFLGTLML